MRGTETNMEAQTQCVLETEREREGERERFSHRCLTASQPERETETDRRTDRERGRDHSYTSSCPHYRKRFVEFCSRLRAAVPNLSLWATGIWRLDSPPDWLTVEDTLTIALRCPPIVQREVEKSESIGREVPSYGTAPWPDPTEGPKVEWIQHEQLSSHSEDNPWDCEECGREIGRKLKDLGVGQPGRCLFS